MWRNQSSSTLQEEYKLDTQKIVWQECLLKSNACKYHPTEFHTNVQQRRDRIFIEASLIIALPGNRPNAICSRMDALRQIHKQNFI